jgi:hypothetical protein
MLASALSILLLARRAAAVSAPDPPTTFVTVEGTTSTTTGPPPRMSSPVGDAPLREVTLTTSVPDVHTVVESFAEAHTDVVTHTTYVSGPGALGPQASVSAFTNVVKQPDGPDGEYWSVYTSMSGGSVGWEISGGRNSGPAQAKEPLEPLEPLGPLEPLEPLGPARNTTAAADVPTAGAPGEYESAQSGSGGTRSWEISISRDGAGARTAQTGPTGVPAVASDIASDFRRIENDIGSLPDFRRVENDIGSLHDFLTHFQI